MGLAFYRELFKRFLSYEDVDTKLNRKGDFKCIGKVVVKDIANKTHEIDFYINYASADNDMHASFSQFMDGTFGIVFSRHLFSTTPLNRLMAIIAHEVGHYLCEHLLNPTYGLQLNNDYDRLVSLSDKAAKKTSTKRDLHNYLRAAMFALLRGGVILREMEADRYALVSAVLADRSGRVITEKSINLKASKQSLESFLDCSMIKSFLKYNVSAKREN